VESERLRLREGGGERERSKKDQLITAKPRHLLSGCSDSQCVCVSAAHAPTHAHPHPRQPHCLPTQRSHKLRLLPLSLPTLRPSPAQPGNAKGCMTPHAHHLPAPPLIPTPSHSFHPQRFSFLSHRSHHPHTPPATNPTSSDTEHTSPSTFCASEAVLELPLGGCAFSVSCRGLHADLKVRDNSNLLDVAKLCHCVGWVR
jgi:hypothetical protein